MMSIMTRTATRARLRIRLLFGASIAVSAAAFVIACQQTGPDAPPRSNGCIDLGCPAVDSGTSSSSGSSGTTTLPDGNVVPTTDPLAGTSKTATLIKGKFKFTEGPVWIGGRLLFTDTSAGLIVELGSDGGTSNFRGNSGGANGLAVDKNNNLIACEGDNKRVTKSAATKGAQTTPIATEFNGNALNSPNDIVARADGNIYFTDPNYKDDANATQDAEAVYRIDTNGDVTRLDQGFTKPNGIALSPDGNTLYVVDNGTGKLLSGAVDAAGAVGAFSEVAAVPGGDGMAVDDAGNLYVADDAGIDVFTKTGSKIGTITVPVKPTNCTFGGADRTTLYITANGPELDAKTGLYSIKLNVPGLP